MCFTALIYPCFARICVPCFMCIIWAYICISHIFNTHAYFTVFMPVFYAYFVCSLCTHATLLITCLCCFCVFTYILRLHFAANLHMCEYVSCVYSYHISCSCVVHILHAHLFRYILCWCSNIFVCRLYLYMFYCVSCLSMFKCAMTKTSPAGRPPWPWCMGCIQSRRPSSAAPSRRKHW